MKMKTKYNFFIIVSLLLVLLSFNAYAFGVTAFYWDKKPLYLNPGESREIQAFGLQNMVGEKDMTIRVEQISGFEIAQIIDKSLNYKIPYGSKDVYINMKITIPPEDEIGQVYSVGLRFRETAGEKQGESVQTVGGMTNSIEVVVGKRIEGIQKTEEIVEEPKEEQPLATLTKPLEENGYVIIGLITLIIILVIIIIFIKYEHKIKRKPR